MAAKSMQEIAVMMRKIRFRKKILGGVDEADVWRQLEQLQKEYRAAYDAQQERNNAWIRERNAEIYRLKKQLAAAGYGRGGTSGQRQG